MPDLRDTLYHNYGNSSNAGATSNTILMILSVVFAGICASPIIQSWLSQSSPVKALQVSATTPIPTASVQEPTASPSPHTERVPEGECLALAAPEAIQSPKSIAVPLPTPEPNTADLVKRLNASGDNDIVTVGKLKTKLTTSGFEMHLLRPKKDLVGGLELHDLPDSTAEKVRSPLSNSDVVVVYVPNGDTEAVLFGNMGGKRPLLWVFVQVLSTWESGYCAIENTDEIDGDYFAQFEIQKFSNVIAANTAWATPVVPGDGVWQPTPDYEVQPAEVEQNDEYDYSEDQPGEDVGEVESSSTITYDFPSSYVRSVFNVHRISKMVGKIMARHRSSAQSR